MKASGKAHRKSTAKQEPKLTDFFTRKSDGGGPSSSPKANISPQKPSKHSQAGPVAKPTKPNVPPPEREIITISSDSHISVSSDSVVFVSRSTRLSRSKLRGATTTEATVTACPKQRTTLRTKARVQPLDISALVPVKPHQSSQTPGLSQRGSLPVSANRLKLSAKRKKKFENDSDVEMLDTVIYVPRPVKSKQAISTPVSHPLPLTPKENLTSSSKVRTPSYKKQRLSSPEPMMDVDDLIPSSQSDEQELVPLRRPSKSLKDVTEIIARWREETLPCDDFLPHGDEPSPLNVNVNVDTEVPIPAPQTPEVSALDTMCTEVVTKYYIRSTTYLASLTPDGNARHRTAHSDAAPRTSPSPTHACSSGRRVQNCSNHCPNKSKCIYFNRF